jgi:hypothetical protein
MKTDNCVHRLLQRLGFGDLLSLKEHHKMIDATLAILPVTVAAVFCIQRKAMPQKRRQAHIPDVNAAILIVCDYMTADRRFLLVFMVRIAITRLLFFQKS